MKKLFDNTKLNNLKLKNRFIRSAVCEKLADEEGHLLPNYKRYYEELSKGGVGLIITGYTTIFPYDKPSSNMAGIYDESFIEEYKEVTKVIHENGGKVISQIVLGKEYKNGNFSSYEFTDDFKEEHIKDIIDSFAQAALRVKKSGFDGVQLHCAHGYFLSRTLSPLYNKRSDEYGKDRYKLIAEIYKKVREVVGKDFLVGMKINCRDKEENGGDFDICYETSIELDRLGIDFIEISGGDFYERKYNGKESIYLEEASKIAEKVKSKVALVALNRTITNMESILNETRVEYISMARPFICESDIVNKFEKGMVNKAKCVSCNNCYTDKYGNKCILNKNKNVLL